MSEPAHRTTDATVVGWREWVTLPTLGVGWVKAKIDTGARTSSLHAFDVERYAVDGAPWVRFTIQPWQRSSEDAVVVELAVHDERSVRSSNGQSEVRVVVLVPFGLAGRTVEAEVTLTDRDEMGFRMLVGREALVQGYVVDARLSYAGGRPPRAMRRRNWGRE